MEWKCNCSHNGRISYSIWQKRAGLKFAEVISKLSLLNFYSTDQRAFYYTKCCLQEQKRLSSTTNETCCPLDLSLKFQHRVVTLKRHFPKVGLSWWRYYLGKGYEVSSSHVTWKRVLTDCKYLQPLFTVWAFLKSAKKLKSCGEGEWHHQPEQLPKPCFFWNQMSRCWRDELQPFCW